MHYQTYSCLIMIESYMPLMKLHSDQKSRDEIFEANISRQSLFIRISYVVYNRTKIHIHQLQNCNISYLEKIDHLNCETSKNDMKILLETSFIRNK